MKMLIPINMDTVDVLLDLMYVQMSQEMVNEVK